MTNTQKLVEDAFERTIVKPLNGRYDEKHRAQDFAMFSLGYRQALARSSQEWMPIETADQEIPVLLYSPPENLYNDPAGKPGDIRVAAPRNFTWATHYMPLPQPPNKEQR